MDASRIGRLRRDIERELRTFDGCFARSEGRQHLRCYVGGQLSQLPRKCVEAIADAAAVPPRTLQDFLATHRWDHEAAMDRLEQLVAEQHYDPEAIGLIDETSYPKRGDKTIGVQRQYCGASGKIDNCMVSVAQSCQPHGNNSQPHTRCTFASWRSLSCRPSPPDGYDAAGKA